MARVTDVRCVRLPSLERSARPLQLPIVRPTCMASAQAMICSFIARSGKTEHERGPVRRVPSRGNAHRQRLDPANEAGINPLRLPDHLDPVEAFEHFLP